MARRKRETLVFGDRFQHGIETIEIDYVPSEIHDIGYDPERARIVVYRQATLHGGLCVVDILEADIRTIEKLVDELYGRLIRIQLPQEDSE